MNQILITGGILIDGKSDKTINNGSILIKDGIIVDISEEKIEPEGKFEVIDATGCTILPGLIDCHVHLNWDGGPEPAAVIEGEPDTMVTIRSLETAKKFLNNGITTVRDVASIGTTVFSLSRAIEKGITQGPRIVCCGPAICMTGGHCADSIGFEADGADMTRQTARQFLKAGVDFIKIMSTGGMYGVAEEPGMPEYTVEEMKAIVEEAHKAKKKVASHAEGYEGIRDSIKAGVDSIEHGIYADRECLEKMLEKGMFLVPTMAAFYPYAEGEGVLPSSLVEKGKDAVKQHMETVKNAIELGVKIAAGTDCGGRNKPPEVFFKELKLYEKAGMKPMDVIKTATSMAAKCIDVDDIGVIEENYKADLLIVKDNPLEDLDNLRNACKIISKGKVVGGKNND